MEQVAKTVTVQDLNDKALLIEKLRGEESQASNAKKIISERLETAEKEMIELLKSQDLTSFRSPVGLLTISHRTSVKTPKTPEDRAKFFDYLREKGLFDKLVTVNSQTLNSFYKSEMEEAKEAGADDFEVPGITEVKMEENLSFRKA